MKTNRIIILLAGLLILTSCASTKYIYQEGFDDIKNVGIVTPFTDIEIIQAADSIVYDSEATAEFADLITESLMASALPTGKYMLMDLGSESLRYAILSLRDVDPKYAGETRVPRELDKFLEEHGQRYGVFTFANGYLTNSKHYRKELFLSILTTVVTHALSLGMLTVENYIPEKNSFQMWIAVVDSQTDRFVFFNSCSRNGSDPTNEKHVKRAIDKLVKDFKNKK